MEEQINGDETSAEMQTDSGMNENVMAALSYVLGFVTGIIVYLIERDNEYVRWHAAHSMAVFGLLFIANIVLSTISATLFTSLPFRVRAASSSGCSRSPVWHWVSVRSWHGPTL